MGRRGGLTGGDEAETTGLDLRAKQKGLGDERVAMRESTVGGHGVGNCHLVDALIGQVVGRTEGGKSE